MGTLRRRRDRQMRRSPPAAALALFFLLLTSASARPLAHSIMRGKLSGGAVPSGGRASGSSSRAEMEWAAARRRLVGPGSAPPSCRSRCGTCSPCKPVHVPVQPGLNMPLEYYPEAWRCKCGNKLFMP